MIKTSQNKIKLALVALAGLLAILFTSCPTRALGALTIGTKGGSFTNAVETTISSESASAKIRYSIDGSDPTKDSGTEIKNGGRITINSNTTLKAIAYLGVSFSKVVSETYSFKVGELTFSPDGGFRLPTQEISISTTTAGAKIYYTTNGEAPTSIVSATNKLYTAPITISATTTLKAMAIKTDYADSTIKSATFTSHLLKADTTIKVVGGNFSNGTSNVTVSTFWISPYEVTQGDYQVVIGSNPSNPNRGIGDNHPVNGVTWYDGVEYCNALSLIKGLTPCYTIDKTKPDPNNNNTNDDKKWIVICDYSKKGYRLPTEAEWQFAARGGISSNNYTYSGSNTIGDVAWYDDNSGDGGGSANRKSHEVGTKVPNELGIYDMSGNIYEWCWDWYGDYPIGMQNDPQGFPSGEERVTRGGYWNNSNSRCTIPYRSSSMPSHLDTSFGLRLVRGQ